MARKKSTDAPTFESDLSQLEVLVAQLEGGELSLEESLATFTQGVELLRTCRKALEEAEQKVRILTTATPEASLEPFNHE